MSNRKQQHEERTAKVAALRAEQARRERRRRLLTIGAVVAVILALGGGTAAVILGAQRERATVEAAAEEPIADVEETTDLSADHVEAPIEPTALPPVGGDHSPVVQNCGVYTEPVPAENAVHSLEHGAVWITYRPDLSPEDVAALRDLVEDEPYTLLSPYPELAAPVVLTAWGVQLEIEDVADERIATFLAKYVQGEQTPEPGAPCSGGNGTPA